MRRRSAGVPARSRRFPARPSSSRCRNIASRTPPSFHRSVTSHAPPIITMTATMDLAQLRQEYMRERLDEGDVAVDPITQFRAWFDEAVRAGAAVGADRSAEGRG